MSERKLLLPLVYAAALLYGAGCVVENDDDEMVDAGAGTGGSEADAGMVDSGSSAGSGGTAGDAGALGDGGLPDDLMLFECNTRDVEDATEVSEDISEDATWSGVVHVTSAIDIEDGATLTIEPGTAIVMGVDTDIELGWNANAATVFAEGTPDDPITFCGASEEPAYWGGLIVGRNVTSDSILRNVLIADAGGNDAGLILNKGITLANVQVRSSGSDGVHASDFDGDSAQLSVEGAADAAAVLTGTGAATNFPLDGIFENNGDNTVHVAFSDIVEDTTFHQLPVPYMQDDSVDVEDSVTLTFEAGVEYRFGSDTDLEVGWNSNDPTIIVNGTESEPVRFLGNDESAGFWQGLLIQGNVRSNSKLSHLEIMHGGASNTPALRVRAPITLDHVTLNTNATGARIDAQGVANGSTMLTVTDTDGVPLSIQPNAWVTLPADGDFTGNSDDRIEVEGGDYTAQGTVPNPGVPYRVLGAIDTEQDSELTIEAGTVFEMDPDTDLEIGWNSQTATITAEGTSEHPIIFRGVDEAKGSWHGIRIRRNVVSTSILDYVEIRHAGKSGNAALLIANPITVTNATIAMSAGDAIRRDSDDTTDYTSSNSFDDIDGMHVADL